MSAAMDHRLEGLEPDNLLAFMALLGALRALEAARPEWGARAFWDDQTAPLRPVLRLTVGESREGLATAAAAGVAMLARVHRFDRKDLNYTASEARDMLISADDPIAAALFDALASNAAVRDDGRIWPTPFCFLFGQGHQHFLERLADVPNGKVPKSLQRVKAARDLNAPQFIADALFSPWTRADRTDSFRWDPVEDRRYALRAVDPSGDPLGTQHGANRLAAIGLPVFSGTAIVRRGETRFISRATAYGARGRIEFCWPIWTRPARLTGLRALLAHPALTESEPRLEELAPHSVSAIFRAERLSVGKFFNVTAGERKSATMVLS
jgi:hypothetical protein